MRHACHADTGGSPRMNVVQLVSEWVMWILGGLASLLIALGGPLFATYNRAKDNQEELNDVKPLAEEAHETAQTNRRILAGEDDDPTHDGILEIVEDNNRHICQLEERMEEQHERVLDRLEEVTGEQ